MKSLYSFIIKPYDNKYNNTVKVDNVDLIVNSNIESHLHVSKKAVVVETPAAFKTEIKKNDVVYVHHNIFRRYYDIKGIEKPSSTFFKDDLYFANIEQIYMYNSEPNLDYCFVMPVKNKNLFETSKEELQAGIVKYPSKQLVNLGVKKGDLITFTPDSEFEFIINGERLYCMKSNDIALTNEYEGNEEENNPSWAEGN